MKKARPEFVRVTLRDDPAGSTPLDLPARRTWPAGLAVGIMFAVFTAILWAQISKLDLKRVTSVFDLSFAAFEMFWILGWSVGVLILAALTVLLLCYGESARLAPGRLLLVPRLGPLKFIVGYDLARMRNLRLESVGGNADQVRVRFDYADGRSAVGDTMRRADAERLIEAIRRAAPATITAAPEPATGAAERPPLPVKLPAPKPLPLTSAPALALIGANLLPLAGVLLGHWRLGDVMLLFWCESAIIGFFTILKLAIAGGWTAFLSVPFFAAHFGGFMAAHFLFIYGFFLDSSAGDSARGMREALAGMFPPLWPAFAALAASHAVSFGVNFLGRHEYSTATTGGLMAAPYRRVMLMHVTVIFGGWLAMLSGSSVAALALLIVLKIAADVHGHRLEHAVKGQL